MELAPVLGWIVLGSADLTALGAGLVAAATVFLTGWCTSGHRRRRRRLSSPSFHRLSVPSLNLFDAGADKVRRQSARNKVLLKVSVREMELPGDGARGWMLDRSRGGLCLLAPQGAIIGTVLHVRLAQAPGDADWTLVTVRHCQPSRGGWRIGCQYLSRPATEDLTAFMAGGRTG